MAIDRSKQGTAFSGFEAEDQTAKQRAAFSEPDGHKGASSESVFKIFRNIDKPTPDYIMSEAIKLMATDMSVGSGENPDFNAGLTHEKLNFSDGNDKFDDVVSLADGPSLLGPNLSVPDMENLPDDTTSDSTETIAPEFRDGTFNNFGSAGFGISIDRNNPDFERVDGNAKSFLSRRGVSVSGDSYTSRANGEETLGEYLNSDTYGYTE